jgi:hypothetical protein
MTNHSLHQLSTVGTDNKYINNSLTMLGQTNIQKSATSVSVAFLGSNGKTQL